MKKLTIISTILTIIIVPALWYWLFSSQPVSETHYNDYWSYNQTHLTVVAEYGMNRNAKCKVRKDNDINSPPFFIPSPFLPVTNNLSFSK